MRLDPEPDSRRALSILLLRELRASRAAALAEGTSPEAISALLDERIALLADAPRPADPVTFAGPAGQADSGGGGDGSGGSRAGRDDLDDRGDDPVDLGGIGQ